MKVTIDTLKRMLIAALLLILPSCTIGHEYKQNNETISLEWVDITTKNVSTLESLSKKLETIYIDAFKEQETTRLRKDYPKVYQEMLKNGETIEKRIGSWWQADVDRVSICLAKGIEKIPLAIIKNIKNDILGFVLFFPVAQEIALETMPFLKTQWTKTNNIKKTVAQEVYVAPLIVRPDCQGHGYGKKLIFSIFSHLPHIKRIYLITFASETWKKTQGFYEHCGFAHTATYVDGYNCQYRFYEFNSR